MTGLYSYTISFSTVHVTTKGALPGTSSAHFKGSGRILMPRFIGIWSVSYPTILLHTKYFSLMIPSMPFQQTKRDGVPSNLHTLCPPHTTGALFMVHRLTWFQGKKVVPLMFTVRQTDGRAGAQWCLCFFTSRVLILATVLFQTVKSQKKIKVCIIWTRVCFYNSPRNDPKVTLNNVGRASEVLSAARCLCPITLTKTPICSSLGGSSFLDIHAVSRL